MSAIHISRVLESDHLPELKEFVGKQVEIVVSDKEENSPRAKRAALVKAQGKKPVTNLDSIVGKWGGDIDDGFEDMIRAMRNQHTPRNFEP